jgi:hypothetical protein
MVFIFRKFSVSYNHFYFNFTYVAYKFPSLKLSLITTTSMRCYIWATKYVYRSFLHRSVISFLYILDKSVESWEATKWSSFMFYEYQSDQNFPKKIIPTPHFAGIHNKKFISIFYAAKILHTFNSSSYYETTHSPDLFFSGRDIILSFIILCSNQSSISLFSKRYAQMCVITLIISKSITKLLFLTHILYRKGIKFCRIYITFVRSSLTNNLYFLYTYINHIDFLLYATILCDHHYHFIL